jgi:VWFA-related protein
MAIVRYVCTLIFAFSAASTSLAQAPPQPTSQPPQPIKIRVVVDDKSGQPVTNLGQQDFTVLDNKDPRAITSFKIASGAAEPVHVILFLDAVNTSFSLFSYMRQDAENYLKADKGKLAYPTAIAVLTDDGAKIVDTFSSDGNKLNDILEHHDVGLRQITRSAQWGGLERLNVSVSAFHQLLEFTATIPGRKLVLWISPGFPLISGPRINLTDHQENQIFGDIVQFSAQMQQNNVTVYNINPIGSGQSLSRADYYRDFLKGVPKPGDVQFADLSIQVLSVHSGGLTIEGNSDVNGMIQRCLADAQSWYEITYDPPPAERVNDYHHVEIKLSQRNLVARTSDGYYANMQVIEPRH